VHGYWLQLMETERLPWRLLRQLQSVQLAARLAHAAQYSPHFRDLIGSRAIDPRSAHRILAGLPLLTRSDLQTKGADLFPKVGREHGKVVEKRTTGSTGQPVTVMTTQAAFAFREAVTMRTYHAFGVDFAQPFAAIRSQLGRGQAEGVSLPDWGGSLGRLLETGPSHGLSLDTPLDRQAAWLLRHRPGYLLTYPSNLALLAEVLPEPWPGLRAVMTLGENVSDDLRDLIRTRWGVPIFDQYSSEELGTIAAQCEKGAYHVVSEGAVVELLDDAGRPVGPGGTGRVVVTDLQNLATTLLRYELRDWAEAGEPCGCGRYTPVIRRIVGRTRNRLTLPDGRKIWPNAGLRRFKDFPVRQMQLVQVAIDRLELRVHVDRPLDDADRSSLAAYIRGNLGECFVVEVMDFQAALPAGPGGKFEQFVSLLP